MVQLLPPASYPVAAGGEKVRRLVSSDFDTVVAITATNAVPFALVIAVAL